MKPHLPLSLLSALLMLGASLAPAQTIINPTQQELADNPWGIVYEDNNLVLNSNVTLPPGTGLNWLLQKGDNTLSGGGSLIAEFDIEEQVWDSEFDIYSSEMRDGSELKNVSISGVTFNGVDVDVEGHAVFNCDFVNASVFLSAGSVDLTKAHFSGESYLEMWMGVDEAEISRVILPPSGTLSLTSNGIHMGVGADGIIRGNASLSGTGTVIADPQSWGQGEVLAFYTTEYCGSTWATLTIEGSLTLGSAAISFESDTTLPKNTDSASVRPDSDHPLFICNSLSGSLSNLKPFIVGYDEEEDAHEVRALTNYGFQAVTGDDGLTYIYLTKNGETPTGPSSAAFEAKEGETLTLTDGDNLSKDDKLSIKGGTADVSAISSTLNNEMITGTTAGGTLVTADTQTMELTKAGSINYDIVGSNGGAAAALLVKSDVTLKGDQYASNDITVESGTLTIGEDSTLGIDGDSQLTVNAKATNMGTVVAKTTVNDNAALLNMGTMEGDITVCDGGVLTNNADITGSVTAQSGAKLFGTGNFGDTLLNSGALLHVGNSPGYQHHDSLTLEDGSHLSFSVDGVTPATLTAKGNGTHSQLHADTLTLNGTPTVTVEFTLGYVYDLLAGNDSKVTLITIGSGDLTALESAVSLDDKTGYLENLQIFADATSLSITADLSEAAQELLLQGDIPEPTADTMWASRALVRDFAHTAEQQMIIGAPGQTTVWGAALGSFVHMSGGEGFTAENGGGAVGVQHAFTEQFRAGVALGQSFGSFRTKEHFMDVDQRGTMLGATAQYVASEHNGMNASVNGHIAIGSVRNEGSFDYGEGDCAKSNWNDRVLSLGSRASLWMFPAESVTVVPFIGLEYQRVMQSSHTEEDIRYTDGAMQTLTLPVGVTLRTQCALPDGELFVPEITLAYEGDIVREAPHVTVRESGMNHSYKGIGNKPGRHAFRMDAGANLLLDAQWSVGAFYHLEAREGATSQSCNASVRYSF
ncbi:MAG: autotransporter domain-containing protein [Akkermansia sp.]|nr:autotransporter domain-containing protein [Akkermansia sp.]